MTEIIIFHIDKVQLDKNNNNNNDKNKIMYFSPSGMGLDCETQIVRIPIQIHYIT